MARRLCPPLPTQLQTSQQLLSYPFYAAGSCNSDTFGDINICYKEVPIALTVITNNDLEFEAQYAISSGTFAKLGVCPRVHAQSCRKTPCKPMALNTK